MLVHEEDFNHFKDITPDEEVKFLLEKY